ncbi:MAG TPA: class I SAM-dependent methyltransferase [Solirubrobacteraceae bacterium]|nr:class I SAM-dependent methyltransferase [Solirubrobacteraceae bacterium]
MDERRRLSFGGVADLYHRSRPSYPEALVDGVLEFAGAGESDRAVEVGAGTGKATVLFAARGLDVVGIEPSAEMAQLARRNCAGYENVTIEEIEFERWRPPGHEFRLVLSAQAWHWIAPEVRYVAARAALEDGGALAAFWNRPEWIACDLREQLAGASGFDAAEVRRYPWHQEYTTADYLALLGTHSACVVLDAPERERLLGDIAAAIDARGGRFRMTYATVLCLARAS